MLSCTHNHTFHFPRRAGSATFGGLLVAGLAASSERGGAAVSARAARVLAHLLLDNPAFKQRVLAIPLEASPATAAGPRLLMPRCLANLSQALLSDGATCARLALEPSMQPSSLLLHFHGSERNTLRLSQVRNPRPLPVDDVRFCPAYCLAGGTCVPRPARRGRAGAACGGSDPAAAGHVVRRLPAGGRGAPVHAVAPAAHRRHGRRQV